DPRPIMGDVLTFTPRPKPAAPDLEPLAGGALRASLEAAAQVALDAAAVPPHRGIRDAASIAP
ncbi:hypothetical protein MKL09_10705, partial [Methylobacterium sp. J-048]|nr:hypothetical protein [Methylobacterium sp. J-048]